MQSFIIIKKIHCSNGRSAVFNPFRTANPQLLNSTKLAVIVLMTLCQKQVVDRP